jgi:hypothetical protein
MSRFTLSCLDDPDRDRARGRVKAPSRTLTRIAAGDCPICECDLEFHRPDEEFPERKLAICPFCRAWFVVQGGECVEVTLPR